MCLLINGPKHVATEDVKVYKLLHYEFGELVSIIKDYVYEPGVIQPHILLKETNQGTNKVINKGYHAYQNLDDLYNGDIIVYDIVCEFVIPKGSTFYYGSVGDIVASNIIYIKPLKQIRAIEEERNIPDEFTAFYTDKSDK